MTLLLSFSLSTLLLALHLSVIRPHMLIRQYLSLPTLPMFFLPYPSSSLLFVVVSYASLLLALLPYFVSSSYCVITFPCSLPFITSSFTLLLLFRHPFPASLIFLAVLDHFLLLTLLPYLPSPLLLRCLSPSLLLLFAPPYLPHSCSHVPIPSSPYSCLYFPHFISLISLESPSLFLFPSSLLFPVPSLPPSTFARAPFLLPPSLPCAFLPIPYSSLFLLPLLHYSFPLLHHLTPLLPLLPVLPYSCPAPSNSSLSPSPTPYPVLYSPHSSCSYFPVRPSPP